MVDNIVHGLVRTRSLVVIPVFILVLIVVMMLFSGGARADGPDMVTYQGDHGLDVNGNGTYEYLVVEVSVQAPAKGSYSIDGELHDKDGKWAGSTYSYLYFEKTDPLATQLYFSGGLINKLAANGPYTVLITLKNETLVTLEQKSFPTNTYVSTQFEGAASFKLPFSDHGNDLDQDGKFEEIVVDVGIDVSIAGQHSIQAELLDSNYDVIDTNWTSRYLMSGAVELHLPFAGDLIADRALDGPYYLNISLSNNITVVDNLTYRTSAYDADDFDQMAVLQGPFADRVTDADLDGMNENIYIDLFVNPLTTPNYHLYSVSAMIEGPDGNVICSDDLSDYFAPNVVKAITVKIPAGNIASSGVNGPYRVELQLWSYYGNHNHLVDTDSFSTAPYLAQDFEKAAKIQDTITDHAVDDNGTELYDKLVVDLDINASVEGNYYLWAELTGTEGVNIGSSSGYKYLSPGVQTVEVVFSSSMIAIKDVDGPYQVRLVLNDEMNNPLDERTYFTAAYKSSDFEQRAVFQAPYSDQGVDEDGNGLYDKLIVNVTVNIRDAGSYRISGMITTGTSYDYYSVDAYLEAGTSKVSLTFQGPRLSLGTDGPYNVSLDLFDVGYWETLDQKVITTSAYRADQFDFVKIEAVKEKLIDDNSNGLYEYLAVEISTNVSMAGNYVITGTLWDSDYGSSIRYERVDAWLSGQGSLVLYFSGQDIYINGISGTFNIDVDIYDSTMSTKYHDVSYYTPPYDVGIFEHSKIDGLKLTELDVNANDLIEYLAADFDAYVLNSANYYITSSLYDGDGVLIGENWKTIPLNAGSNPQEVRFSGLYPIFFDKDGPYRIEVDLCTQQEYYPYETIILDSRSVTTGPLTAEDFERPASITEVTETGIDTNGNGYFEGITFGITLNFITTGNYHMTIALLNDDNWVSYTERDISPVMTGEYKIDVPFDAYGFSSIGKDGPYKVQIMLMDMEWGQPCDLLNHTTQAYALNEFEHIEILEIADHGVDLNANGLYDQLVVDFTIEVTSDSYCSISGTLYDGSMVELGQASSYLDTISGKTVVSLAFDGLTIGSRKISGPLTLQYQVYSSLGQVAGTYMTSSIDGSKFEHLLATGDGKDQGIDEDGDTLYEHLAVDVEVRSSVEGDFFAYGLLMDGTGSSWIAMASINFHAVPGDQMVRFNISGSSILSSGIDGPYLLRIVIGQGSSMMGGGEYVTGPYLAASFEAPAILADHFSDQVLNGDLAVEVEVEVSASGWYSLSGSLYVNNGWWGEIQGTYANRYLELGKQTMTIVFSGTLIRNNEVDGPYKVILELYDIAGSYFGSIEQMTQAYSWNEFYSPAQITGCTDHLNDLDGNGLGEQLAIDVQIDVQVSGTYQIQISCMDVNWGWIGWTSDSRYLEAGPQIWSIPLSARMFLDHGMDGPYEIELQLGVADGTPYQYYTYWTSPYTLANLEWPAYLILPPADHGLDTDGDGLYEYLALELMVDVKKPGIYELENYLRDSSGMQIDMFWTMRWLDAGMNKVLLLFPGSMIMDNMLQGQLNYEVDLWWLGPNAVDLFLERYTGMTSGYYDHGMFEPSTRMQFPNPWVDNLVDTNRNGLYDWLEVEVTVNVAQAGKYTITCELYANRVNDLITTRSISWDLKEGSQTLRIRLPGTDIWAKGLDGPYTKVVRLSDRWGNPIDEGYGRVRPDCAHEDFETFRFDIGGGKGCGIDLRSNDPIEVVIHGSRFVLVKYIDPRSVLLGVGEDWVQPYKWAFKDVDHDGYNDLVLKFKSKEMREILGSGTNDVVLKLEYKGSQVQMEQEVWVRSGRCGK